MNFGKKILFLLMACITLCGSVFEIIPCVATDDELNKHLAAYAIATNDVVVSVCQNITFNSLASIPLPAKAGITLTIRSANPSSPFTIKRGASGNLFTVQFNVTLILKDVIIDGDKDGIFDD